MSNSSLVTYTKISPNKNSPRNHAIDTITIHCTAGSKNNTAAQIAAVFAPTSRQASCNYAVGGDGSIALVVDEGDRSWCTSSSSNDNRAITLEVASNTTGTEVNAAAYNATIKLVADICKRNNIKKLVWSTDKNTRMNHLNGCNMTVHRDYANKSCPGPYLYGKMGDIATAVNKLLGSTSNTTSNTSNSSTTTTTSNSTTTSTVNSIPSTVPFTVKVLVSDLNIRSSASTSGAVKGQTGKGTFTITKVSGEWGYLKSELGWIYLGNSSWVTIGKSSVTSSSSSTSSFTPYVVKINANALNVRKGPGTNYDVVMTIKDMGKYTIVEESNGWGKLKSGIGWISLTYTKKV